MTEDPRMECAYCRRLCYPVPVKTDDGVKYLCVYCQIGEEIAREVEPVCEPHEYQTGTKEISVEQSIVYCTWTCSKCGATSTQVVGEISVPMGWKVVD